jgi:hypothetical protein
MIALAPLLLEHGTKYAFRSSKKKTKRKKKGKKRNPVNTDSITIYKWIAIAAVGLYLYKASQANGGSLSGNNMGINDQRLRENSDKIVDSVTPWLGIQNPILKEAVRHGAKHIMRRV